MDARSALGYFAQAACEIQVTGHLGRGPATVLASPWMRAGRQGQLDQLDVAARGDLVERRVTLRCVALTSAPAASSTRQTSACRPAAAA